LRTLLTQFQLPGGNIAATRHMTELAASPALHLVTRVPRARGAAAPAAESSEEF
jgi:methyl-accepting chemotaxis protein